MHYFFFHWLYSPLGSWALLFSFMIILQTVGLLGRVTSSSQGLYLNTRQHKHRINTYTHQTSMPCVGFKPTIPGFRASEDSSCLRPLGYCDRPDTLLLGPHCSVRCSIFRSRNYRTVFPWYKKKFRLWRIVAPPLCPTDRGKGMGYRIGCFYTWFSLNETHLKGPTPLAFCVACAMISWNLVKEYGHSCRAFNLRG
jgi:hypothetical protein